MLNLATEFYTFRHTAVLTSLQEPDSYTDENFGNINDNDGYVIDPYFFKKTVEGAKDFKNEDGFFAQALVQLNIDDSNWAGMAPANSWSRIYCLENCMFRPAQLNAYTTGVMFKASLDIATDRVFNESGETVSNPSNWPTNLFYFNYNFYTSEMQSENWHSTTCPETLPTTRQQKSLPNTASSVSRKPKTTHATTTTGSSMKTTTTTPKWESWNLVSYATYIQTVSQ